MFGIANIALGLLAKTKLGQKVKGKVMSGVGRILGKIGKKRRAGDGNKSPSVQDLAFDKNPSVSNTIVAGEDEQHPVSDALGDFLGRVKTKAGPIETKIGADKTMLYVGVGAAALIVLGVVMSKK